MIHDACVAILWQSMLRNQSQICFMQLSERYFFENIIVNFAAINFLECMFNLNASKIPNAVKCLEKGLIKMVEDQFGIFLGTCYK